MAGVELRGVSKVFGKVYAVRDVDLEVRDGEFFALLGPSGSGKTTLLRIIAGLERPTRGRVFIDGRDVTDLPPRKRDVAMVFQTWALYPHMRVYDNIAFPLRIRGVPEGEIRRRVKEVAEILGIEGLLDRMPRQLSGGQQQRVALARALVRNPKVWLMDEPLSNLDALLRVVMRVELRRLQRRVGVTTIYVTHDQAEAMAMADRIAVMSEGVVRQVGTPREVYENPSDTFVAGFIGNPPMNVFRARLRPGEGLVELPGGATARASPRLLEAATAAGLAGEAFIGFRPEHATLNAPAGGLYMEGSLVHVELLGSEAIANVAVGDVIVKVRVDPDARLPPPGSRVTVAVPERRVRMFHPETGRLAV